MHLNDTRKWRARAAACASMFAVSVFGFGASAQAADPVKAVDTIKTATPIKHVIIIVGENRSFDHLFATYVPKSKNERVKLAAIVIKLRTVLAFRCSSGGLGRFCGFEKSSR